MPMDFSDVLSNFQYYSRSFFIACASTAVLMNFLVMFLLVNPKFSKKIECDSVMLFSLALCDLLYEATTTTLLFWTNSCKEAGNYQMLQMLYFFYLAFNLCTIFHIFVDITQKTVLEFYLPSQDTLPCCVCWSVASWLAAFGLGYVDLKTGNGLLDLDVGYMTFLSRFKAFGYIILMVIFVCGILVVILTLCVAKPPAVMKKSPLEKFHCSEMNIQESFAVFESPLGCDLVFTCILLAIFVAWCGWVMLAVDSRALKTVEVMKSFEFIRLAARIMSPMTILYHIYPVNVLKLGPVAQAEFS